MKKKILLSIGIGLLSLGTLVTPVYAFNSVSSTVGVLGSNVLQTDGFDYSVYSKEEVEKIADYLEEKSLLDENLAGHYKMLKIEVDVALEKDNFNDEDNTSYLNILVERLENEAESSVFFKDEYKQILKIAQDDLKEYKGQQRQKKKEQKELEDFRKTQIEWSKNFLTLFTELNDYSQKDFSLQNINIYDFFTDGEYHSPIDNPSLSKIIKQYSKDHYGAEIAMNENDNVYSVANNAVVSINKDGVTLTLDNNVKIVYKNVASFVEDGTVVNKGDIVGVFRQTNTDYDGMFLSMVKDNKEYSTEWLFTEFPCITEKGMSMPLLLQYYYLWNDNSFGCSSIGPSGCGPSSLSMVISYLKGEFITPAQICYDIGGSGTKYYCPGAGSYWVLIDDAPGMYGLNSRRISKNEVIESLQNDCPVICIMREGEFTSGGHFITLSGLDENGNIYVNDSYDSFDKHHFDRTFSLDFIASQCMGYWEISR